MMLTRNQERSLLVTSKPMLKTCTKRIIGYTCGQTFSEMVCHAVNNYMLPEFQLEKNYIPEAKLVKNPSECNLEELKGFLECRKQKKSGKKMN